MAQNERDTDRDDTPKDDGARPGLPYDPAVLAAKLAAAREQRRRILAARAAAEDEPTPEARRAKLPPFARPAGGTSRGFPTGDADASSGAEPTAAPAGPAGAPEPAPDERAGAPLEEHPAPARQEPGARVPDEPAPAPPPQAAPGVSQPGGAAPASENGEPAASARSIPSPRADRARARRAEAGLASAPAGRKPRRRRPATLAEPPSPTPERSAPAMRSSTLLARSVPVGVLMVGWLLATLVFFAPSTVRQRIADAIAPDPVPSVATTPSVSQPPPPSPAGEPGAEPRPAIGVELATPEVERRASTGEPSASGTEPGAPDAATTTAASPPGAGGFDETTRPRPDAVLAEPAHAATGPAPSPPPSVGADEEGVPAPRNAASEATAASTAPAGDAERAGPAPVTGLGPAAATSRVVLHFPASAVGDARRVEATLRTAGVAEITLVPAAFPISRANVRYYEPEYRALGRAVADIAGRHVDGAPVEIRDFTAFRPQPSAGTLELWLAGTNEAPVPDARTPSAGASAATGPAAEIVTPSVGPRADEARIAERERLEDEVTRLLRARLQDLQPE